MELRAEDVKNIRSLVFCKEILRQAIELNDQLNEELRHANYKRCVAMAEWCDAEADVADADGDYEDMRWYQKWHERWLKIAKQFKEDE